MTQPKPQDFFVAYCIFAIFMMLGLYAAGISVRQLYFATASQSWPSCEGMIRHAEVKKFSKRNKMYGLSISYDYVVDSKPYVGNKYRLGGYALSLDSAQKLVDEYPVGSAVKVYYSPDSPQQSVIVPGRGWGNYVYLGLGTCWFMLGLGGFIFGYFRRLTLRSEACAGVPAK